MVFYDLSDSNSSTFPVFHELEKKDDKVFSKNIVMFWHSIASKFDSFFFLILYDNYDYNLKN